MEQSREMRGFLSSLIETFGTPRMGPAIAEAVAAGPGVLMVGTDPAEWWDDPGPAARPVAPNYRQSAIAWPPWSLARPDRHVAASRRSSSGRP
jgi:hypothetical protein